MQHIRLLHLYAKKNCSVLNRVFPRRQIMRYNSFNNIILATSLINNFSRATSTSSSAASSIMTPPSSTTVQSPSSNGADNDCLLSPEHMQSYKVINNTQVSTDSNLLTIALPNERSILGWEPDIPTCISISKTEEDSGNVLKKSYSPISHPSQPHNFQLLVKAYPHRIGGGVGSYLCNLQVGDEIQAKVKPQRIMHNHPHVHNRWKHVGLIAGGTGIAPLYQLLMILLNDCVCKVQVLSINRVEEDILLKKELDNLVKEYPDRVSVVYSLTGSDMEDTDRGYKRGRGDTKLALDSLPDPTLGEEVMIFVCGKDGFVEHWGGSVGRAPNKADGSKGKKIQGELLGVLKEAGYDASQVFKY